MKIAHVFWDGPITKYEIASLLSIKKSGFEVNFWCFNDYDVPKGIIIRNAGEILSKEFIDTYTQTFWNQDDETKPKNSRQWSVTLYSDMLRYELLSRFGGWWFDLDVLCIKNADAFEDLYNKKDICVGFTYFESKEKYGINIAIFSIPNKTIAKEILDRAKSLIKTSNVHPWGIIGPEMIATYVREKDIFNEVLHEDLFNPIGGNLTDIWIDSDLLDPGMVEKHFEYKRSSYALHWYNHSLETIDKQKKLPNENSFMGKEFQKLGIYDL